MSQLAAIPVIRAKTDLLDTVTVIALVTLPFMTALTVDVGFPLKIYEVVLLAAATMTPFAGRLLIPTSAVRPVILTASWMALAGIFLWFRLVFPLHSASGVGLVSRFGPSGDGITKFIYLLLDLYGFMLFARFAARNEDQFIKYWVAGACIAAVYSYYLFLMNMAGVVEPPVLPGAAKTQIALGGHLFIRCATFREGNEAGLYFAISALLALHGNRRKAAWVLFGAVITTFSTLALIILLGICGWLFWRGFQKLSLNLKILLAPLMLIIALGAGTAVVATTVFQAAVLTKLSGQAGSAEAFSRLERLAFAQAAGEMFLEHPLMGVGVAQFGYNFSYYSNYPLRGKPIPNVVYLEFLSEDGLVVSAIFAIFFCAGFRATRNEPYLRAGYLSLVVGFFAYTTISVMFIWGLFGLIFGRPIYHPKVPSYEH